MGLTAKKIFTALASITVLMFISASFVDAAQNDPSEENIDIDRIDFSKPPYTQLKVMLNNYLPCMAAAKNRIDYCNTLGGKMGEECRRDVNLIWNFYGKLAMTKRPTPAIESACKETSDDKEQKDSCGDTVRLYATDDPSKCNAINDPNAMSACKAYVAGDPSLCPRDKKTCIDRATLSQAAKNNDVGACQKLTSVMDRWICVGGLTGDARECENCPGFKEFKKQVVLEKAKVAEADKKAVLQKIKEQEAK